MSRNNYTIFYLLGRLAKIGVSQYILPLGQVRIFSPPRLFGKLDFADIHCSELTTFLCKKFEVKYLVARLVKIGTWLFGDVMLH